MFSLLMASDKVSKQQRVEEIIQSLKQLPGNKGHSWIVNIPVFLVFNGTLLWESCFMTQRAVTFVFSSTPLCMPCLTRIARATSVRKAWYSAFQGNKFPACLIKFKLLQPRINRSTNTPSTNIQVCEIPMLFRQSYRRLYAGSKY